LLSRPKYNAETENLLVSDFAVWSDVTKPFAAIVSLEFSNHCSHAMKLTVRQMDWQSIEHYIDIESWPLNAS